MLRFSTARTILLQFANVRYQLSSAVLLSQCRSSFCVNLSNRHGNSACFWVMDWIASFEEGLIFSCFFSAFSHRCILKKEGVCSAIRCC